MNSTDRIEEALKFIDPHDRDTWVKVGMAIKSELGDSGFEIWQRWSEQADSFNGRDARDVWKSISQSGRVTIGSLFHEAKANGWRGDGFHHSTSMEEFAERQRITEERVANDQAEIDRERANTAANAAAIWNASIAAQPDNPYLALKQIAPVTTLREIDAGKVAQILGYSPKCRGERLSGRLLVVPVKQGNALSTLELIDGDKRKTALAGRGTKACGYWATRELPDGEGKDLTVLIGEGVATVLSASQASDYLAVASLSSSNLVAVAKAIRGRFPEASLVILADLVTTTGQPDAHAFEAADAVDAAIAAPDFGPDRRANETDFNDMAITTGNDAVGKLIASVTMSAKNRINNDNHLGALSVSSASGWPAPLPFAASTDPEEYPIGALPSIIREAVEEVAEFVKAPISMVASSALSTVSLALQAFSDVKRLPKLEGPIGLFSLVIADSGERKSTCDTFFSKSIRTYEKDQEEATKELLTNFRAAWDSWEAKRNGVKDEIRRLAKKQESTSRLELALQTLERDRPKEPRVPRLLYADATPEALAFSLSKKWPTGGVVSAEAGIVFGSHGMGKDSVMRNLALFNQLWDGATLKVDRKSSESFTVRGARLTIALQVQEPTLHQFFERSGALARGTGFLARFLVAWPKSTQGTRFIDPRAPSGPESWPRLAAFHQRIAEILSSKIPLEGDDGLNPPVLEMSPEATASWIEYYNDIESQLLPGGEFYDIKDVASKSADNAARLAALFQLFAGQGEVIGLTALNGACLLAGWHLQESMRFFGELALPVDLADAARLDRFVVDYCRQEGVHQVAHRDLQRLGPVRDGDRLKSALKVLEDHFRTRQVNDGRRKIVQVNPSLIAELP